MELPRYIVMKVECEPKSTTITITDISERCDVIEHEDKTSCSTCIHRDETSQYIDADGVNHIDVTCVDDGSEYQKPCDRYEPFVDCSWR